MWFEWPTVWRGALVSTDVELALVGAGSAQEQKSRPRRLLEGIWNKVNLTSSNDGVVRQLIERRSFRQPFRTTLTADVTANVVRNVWSYAIIFCGHFPDQTYTFSQEETAEESRGAYYVRQLLGAGAGAGRG
jgi:NADPH-dependent stearoyl-CoA 9-desaturase